jgi:hypothetical protein
MGVTKKNTTKARQEPKNSSLKSGGSRTRPASPTNCKRNQEPKPWIWSSSKNRRQASTRSKSQGKQHESTGVSTCCAEPRLGIDPAAAIEIENGTRSMELPQDRSWARNEVTTCSGMWGRQQRLNYERLERGNQAWATQIGKTLRWDSVKWNQVKNWSLTGALKWIPGSRTARATGLGNKKLATALSGTRSERGNEKPDGNWETSTTTRRQKKN